MLPNPSFELDNNYFGVIPYWSLDSNTISTRSVAQVKFNTYSLKVESNLVGTNNFETISDFVPVNSNYDHTASMYYFADATVTVNGVYIGMACYDDASALLTATFSVNYITTTVTEGYWIRASSTFASVSIPTSTTKAKIVLGMNATGVGRTVYYDGIQFEEGSGTPYEDFEYYLDDPNYPEIIPPTLWDKLEMAFAVVVQIRNPYGFVLNEAYIEDVLAKFYPAHVKVYLEFLNTKDSLAYMVWDESFWDQKYWY
jgi:hypothetical protein